MQKPALASVARSAIQCTCVFLASVIGGIPAGHSDGQDNLYDVFPEAGPPYYRVLYPASEQEGELQFAVNYTAWIPEDVETLRGIIVHQHGCGEGSCRSGLTGAFDLHWQALARKHSCALISPSYRQPQHADCQLWCDPRNGSDESFRTCLVDLGKMSGHPEMASVPWALWGHSGGGHWSGGMLMLHPERIACVFLRSGVPLLEPNPQRPTIKVHTLPEAATSVPVMCNLGTKEGVTVTGNRFARVWPANRVFFRRVRSAGGLIGMSVDPLTSHECGNQRYFAIPWMDACLTARLPVDAGGPLRDMPLENALLAAVDDELSVTNSQAVHHASFTGDPLSAAWLPDPAVAKLWTQYIKNTEVGDTTKPPAPTDVRVSGNVVTWKCRADLESGLGHFLVLRDGEFLARVPKNGKNRYGRSVFQSLQYSDTPTQPLIQMRFTDESADGIAAYRYRIVAVNTVGLKSERSKPAQTN